MKDGIRVAEIKVRKLEPVIVKKIDELAAEKGMKREAFLRMHLTIEEELSLDRTGK